MYIANDEKDLNWCQEQLFYLMINLQVNPSSY